MSTRVARSAKRWLVCAATGLVLSQPASLPADPPATGEAAGPSFPAPRPTRNPALTLKNAVQREFRELMQRDGQPADAAAPDLLDVGEADAVEINAQPIILTQNETTEGSYEPSALQVELQKLYSRDGRQMPSLKMSDLPSTPPNQRQKPSTQMPAAQTPPVTAAAPAPQPPRAAPQKQGLLSRILPFGRKDPPARTAQRPQMPAAPPVRTAPPAATMPPLHVPAATVTVTAEPPESSEFFPEFEGTETVEMQPPVLQAPAVEPEQQQPFGRGSVAQSPARRSEPEQPQLKIIPEDPAAGPEQTAQAVEEFPDPFTEMSEAQADGSNAPAEPAVPAAPPQPELQPQGSPYTGLTLDEPEIESAPQLPMLPAPAAEEQVVETPPAQAPLDLTPPELQPQQPPKVAAQPQLPNPTDASNKMQRIAERDGLNGFKGFCPVALRENRDLVDSLAAYHSTFEGKTYFFSSSEAKAKFDAKPENYAPINGGHDVILLGNNGQEVEGSLQHAVWYKDRLHLFSSPETMETFVQTVNIASETK